MRCTKQRERRRRRTPKKTINELADKLGVALKKYDVSALHRLPTRKETMANSIIVKLNSRANRGKLMKKAKKKRLPIISYINEHLTRESQKLLNEARAMRDEG